MTRYYTVVKREEDGWFDQVGFTSKQEAREEVEYLRDDGVRRCDLKIIETDGSAADLIAALEVLNGGK